MANICGVLALDGQADDTPTILVLGHTDTVHQRGTLSTQIMRAEAGRLYGPGIFDMKASCVLALEAFRTLISLNFIPKRPAVLLLTCDEEAGSQTGRQLVEEDDGLGIDGGGAQAANEHILISDIARRGALLAGLIASL